MNFRQPTTSTQRPTKTVRRRTSRFPRRTRAFRRNVIRISRRENRLRRPPERRTGRAMRIRRPPEAIVGRENAFRWPRCALGRARTRATGAAKCLCRKGSLWTSVGAASATNLDPSSRATLGHILVKTQYPGLKTELTRVNVMTYVPAAGNVTVAMFLFICQT
jgi:hypothetical protein